MSDQLDRFKTKPYRHQLECLNKFGRKKAFALLAEMGTGKTWIVINNMIDLWSSGDCDAVIVFAPSGVHTNWTRLELPKHMPDWCRYKAVAWTGANTKREQKELEELMKPSEDGTLRILTMNWEALGLKRGFETAMEFVESASKAMIVCDESDAAKNPSAGRTKNLMKLKGYSEWRRIMTGTPINNAPFDAFSQFLFLDSRILGTTSFFAFKAQYAEMLPQESDLVRSMKEKAGNNRQIQIVAKGPGGKKKWKNLDKLSAKIAPHSFRVLKKDCLDLPDKIYKTVTFRLTPQQREAYRKAEQECRLVFEGEEAAFSKLVAVSKLAQITSGYYIHPFAEEPVKIEGDNPKLDLLEDRVRAITEAGDKVIVWARFQVEIRDIEARLRAAGIKTVSYYGEVSKSDRVQAIEDFERGDAQVFIGNQQAGGTGITLVAASYVIYFSNNFSLRDRLQSEDRAHRIGQTRNVTYINLVGEGTVDEAVVEALMNKQDVADTIIDRGLKLFA